MILQEMQKFHGVFLYEFAKTLSERPQEKEKHMKISIQKIISALLSSVLFFSVGTSLDAANAQSWYCKRQKDHIRPEIESSMSYIKNMGGVYLGEDEKVIYLTFDAGYENGNVEKILNTLKKHEAEGAFFILENLINRNPDLVTRMKDEGHLVCNHTSKHKDLTRLSSEEIKKEIVSLETLYEEKIGGKMAPFFRPPEGKFNESSLQAVHSLGYTTVFWSLAYADWDNDKQPSADTAKNILNDHLHNGAVILLHPTSATNAEILDSLLAEWKAEGYRFGSLTELVKTCE
jgi:peptidoglycan-N-acetylmuramic acid deacetylase